MYKKIFKPIPQIIVSEQDNILSLHIDNDLIQSSMSLFDTSELILTYSIAMVAILIFRPEVKQITHIGLGGGSIVRWFAKYFRDVMQTAIEINPKIIALAKSMFELPKESATFSIIQDDGYKWIKKAPPLSDDIIFVDAFTGNGIIEKLSSIEFFENCYQRLTNNGVAVFNWWSNYQYLERDIKRLSSVFGKIIQCPAITPGNIAVMAFREFNPQPIADYQQLAKELTQKTNVDFNQQLAIILNNNRLD